MAALIGRSGIGVACASVAFAVFVVPAFAAPTATPTSTPTPGPIPALVQTAALDTSGSVASVSYLAAVSTGNLLVATLRIGNRTGTASFRDSNANAWQLVDRRADTGGVYGEDLEL